MATNSQAVDPSTAPGKGKGPKRAASTKSVATKPCKYGADCQLFAKGVCIFGHELSAIAQAPVADGKPHLLEASKAPVVEAAKAAAPSNDSKDGSEAQKARDLKILEKPEGPRVFFTPPPHPNGPFQTYQAWLEACAIPFSVADKEGVKWLESQGFPFARVAEKIPSGHTLGAYCRHLAVRVALQDGAKGSDVRVGSWYGFDREARNFTPPESTGLVVQFEILGDAAAAGDAARSVGRRQMATGQYDCIVICDQYKYNNGPMTPQAVLEIMQNLKPTGKIYGIFRIFDGCAGADDFGFDREEGAWIRDIETNQISFSPEPGAPTYCAEWDVNWIQQRHCDGLDIAIVNRYGPYYLVRFAHNPLGIASGPVLSVNSVVSTVDLRSDWTVWAANKWTEWTSWSLPSRLMPKRGPCAMFVVNNLLNSALKIPVGSTLDVAYNSIASALATHGQLRVVKSRFANTTFWRDLTYTTLVYAMYNGRRSIVSELHGQRVANADMERLAIEMRANTTPTAPSKKWNYVGYGVAAVFVLVSLIRRRTARRASVLDTEMLRLALASARSRGYDFMDGAPLAAKIAEFVHSPFHVVILAPIYEELIKRYVPAVGTLMVAMEMHFYNSTGELSSGATIVHGLKHLYWAYLGRTSLVHAMAQHMINNAIAVVFGKAIRQWAAELDPQPASWFRIFGPTAGLVAILVGFLAWRWRANTTGALAPYAAFLRKHADGELPEIDVKSLTVAIPPEPIMPLQSAKMVSVQPARGKMRITMAGRVATMAEVVSVKSVQGIGSNRMWPILVTNGLLWQPSNDIVNLIVGLDSRVHADPFSDDIPADARRVAWEFGLEKIWRRLGWLPQFPSDDFMVQSLKWCAHKMGKQRGDRILAADAALDMGEVDQRKTMTVKWNETIPVKRVGDVFVLTPRIITNLSPQYHSLTLPYARQLADIMHVVFNGQVLPFCDDAGIRIHFCSGYNGADLDRAGDDLDDSSCTTLCVAGDDSYARLSASFDPATPFIEADFSKCDHTQDENPLIFCHLALLRELGFPEAVLEVLQRAFTIAYRVKRQDVTIDGDCEIQMPTGVSVTTTVTTLTNITYFCSTLYRKFMKYTADGQIAWTAEAARMGLQIKSKVLAHITEGTFLRGSWLVARDGIHEYAWVPLPSAVLKIGKIMKDPKTIARGALNPQAVIGRCVALSYGPLDTSVPILGAFLRALNRAGHDSDDNRARDSIVDNVYENPFRVIAAPRQIHREFAVMWACHRYNITSTDIVRVEALLDTVVRLPAYVQDPVFVRLLEVDYQ